MMTLSLHPLFRALAGLCLLVYGQVMAQTTDAQLQPDQALAFSIDVSRAVHVGEPFNYTVRVLYRADQVAPDFPALIRDVRFVPFEQVHLSRPLIRTIEHPDGVHEYTLVYPLQGINVIPHLSYPLDPVTLHWQQRATGQVSSQTVQPAPVQISGYYSADITGQPFQALQMQIDNSYRLKQTGFAILALLLLVYGVSRVRRAIAFRPQDVSARADRIREQFDQVAGSPRAQLLAYERILLTLLFYYRQFSAREFWQSAMAAGTDWRAGLQRLRQGFHPAYREAEPEPADALAMRDSLQSVFGTLQEQVVAERQAQLDSLQGTVWKRIRSDRQTFVRGVLALASTLLLVLLLVRPSLWRDPDIRLYNDWIEGLPARLFDSSMDSRLSSVDVELLVQISEQQEILQQLNSDLIKSAYLYNFGTIVAKAYVAIIAAEDQEEEEIDENEAGASRPSFEFPKQLLANAVRLAPLQEDPRRNLEIAIMLREAEKKDEENGQVQGEIGPPLPGFSRDLNPVLF